MFDTFMNRHMPFTTGKSPTELEFYVPARWSQTSVNDAPLTPVAASASASAVATETGEVDTEDTMWDFTLNKYVPNIMGTEDPEDEAGPKIAVKPKKKKKKKKKKTRKRKAASRTGPKRKQVKKKK